MLCFERVQLCSAGIQFAWRFVPQYFLARRMYRRPVPVHWGSTSTGRSASRHARVPPTAGSGSKSGVSGSEPGSPRPEHCTSQQQQPAAGRCFGVFRCDRKHRRAELAETVAPAPAAAATSRLKARGCGRAARSGVTSGLSETDSENTRDAIAPNLPVVALSHSDPHNLDVVVNTSQAVVAFLSPRQVCLSPLPF